MTRLVAALVALLILPVNLPAQATVPQADVIYMWESGGLAAGTLGRIAEVADRHGASVSVEHRGTIQLLSVTRGDELVQSAPEGFVIPMAALAIDRAASRSVVGSTVSEALDRGEVVMGWSSASLRGAVVGDVVTFTGWDGSTQKLPIGAIVPDVRVRSAEMIFSIETAERFGFSRLSSVTLWGFADGAALYRDLEITFAGEFVGIDPDQGRNPDDVLSDVAAKRQFGEFAYRATGPGDKIQIDPVWVAANIITVNLPILGTFKCHRSMLPYLEHALDEAIDAGLGSVIDPVDFQLAGGCYNARLIRGGDKGGAISRHSWGIAVDFNPSTNRYGGAVVMDPRLAEIFHKWGFAWGGGWVYPDGGHFEWTRLPASIVDT